MASSSVAPPANSIANPAERRLANDGGLYTEEQFEQYHGEWHQYYWNIALLWDATEASASAAKPAEASAAAGEAASATEAASSIDSPAAEEPLWCLGCRMRLPPEGAPAHRCGICHMLRAIGVQMDARGRFLSTADQRDIATVLRVVDSELARRIQLIRPEALRHQSPAPRAEKPSVV